MPAGGAPGEGGLGPGASGCRPGCSGEGAALRGRGERPLHSSKPLAAAAVAELHVALALRGYGKTRQTPPAPGYRCPWDR